MSILLGITVAAMTFVLSRVALIAVPKTPSWMLLTSALICLFIYAAVAFYLLFEPLGWNFDPDFLGSLTYIGPSLRALALAEAKISFLISIPVVCLTLLFSAAKSRGTIE